VFILTENEISLRWHISSWFCTASILVRSGHLASLVCPPIINGSKQGEQALEDEQSISKRVTTQENHPIFFSFKLLHDSKLLGIHRKLKGMPFYMTTDR
jgi:hypothetical protein